MTEQRARLATGNEVCAEAALIAGMRFFAGYPITPSSEIAEILAYELPRYGGVFIQMEDEIGSIAAIIGASLAGKKVMTATSGPGFSLMQENIGYAAMAEVPCVIVNVQRGGPSTGLPTQPSQADTMQTRWGTHGDHPIIVLTPATVREVYDWTIKAFSLAETFRVPVIILIDEIIAHINEKIVYPDQESIKIIERKRTTKPPKLYKAYETEDSDIPEFADFGSGYRYNVTGLSHDETGFPTNDPVKTDTLYRRLNNKIEKNKHKIIEFKTAMVEDAEICLVAYGSSARSAYRAMRQARTAGIKVGTFQILTLWPFPYEALTEMAKKVKAFIVPEMNLGQTAHEISCVARCPVLQVNRVDGSLITPDDIIQRINDVSL